MKKNILLITIGIVLCINAMGQIHKTRGDKPLFSHHYTFESSNDSTPETKTIYTYNNNQQLIKKIRLPYFSNQGNSIDSTVKTYDTNDRIVSSIVYLDDTVSYSEKWVYDLVNNRIDYYDFADASFDSVTHIIYKGVNSFDKIPEPVSSDFFVNGLLETIIDCDTILVSEYNDTTFSWNVVTEIYPIYQNGKLDSAQMKIKNFDASIFGIPNMILDVSLDFKFTYSGDKLMKINGDMEVENLSLPIPSTFPEAIVVTNQYRGNLLIESKTELKISIPIFGVFYMGINQQYAYNSDENISVMVQENSQNGTSWEVSEKTYYLYEENVEDIALISFEQPSAPIDTVGNSINLKVLLKNKSNLTIYQNINIMALIHNSQGVSIGTHTGNIDQFFPASSLLYTFTESYIVPDDTAYFIKVYISSQDTNTLNDTISLKRYTRNIIGDLALVNIYMPYDQADVIGDTIHIGVTLEKKRAIDAYYNIDIMAIIRDSQGDILTTFTETIDQIDTATSSFLYTFTQSYIVPNDSIYSITLYINLHDDDALNNTLYLKRQTKKDDNDLVLISIDSPDDFVDFGETVHVNGTLKNNSKLITYNNINITALIRNSKEETVAIFTKIVPRIDPLFTVSYFFTDSFVIQIHDYYSVTVYTDSYDDNPLNDTIRTQFEIPINVKSIDNVSIYMNQNIPNPANHHTLITYSIPVDGQANFSVYSISGQLLLSQSVAANSGENTLELNTDKLAAGIYFYALEFNKQRIVKKMNISR
ncbi:MAG: T9SS type A sorting domain-containing protein [Bacteroidales bacterium]|nr:T9SS type A sorting domain-containing protein [Bacteroidales bacterium]